LLSGSGGYIQDLLAARKDDPEISPTEQVGDLSETAVESKAAKVAEGTDDKRRQVGDMTVYKYYFSSIGVSPVTVLLFLEILWAFFSTFPSKSPLNQRLQSPPS